MVRPAPGVLVGLVLVSLVAACVDVTVVPTPPPGSSPAAASSSAAPSASASTGPPGPSATLSADLVAQIDAVTNVMPAIRQLSATRDVPYEFISRDQFSQDLVDLNNQDTPPEEQAAEERALERLGLLPPDADLEALLMQLYTAEVAAYYRPDTKSFYIIERNAPFGPLDKVTVAHEYTHALQDMHFDLEGSRIADPSEGDAALAQLAIIEGDAVLASQMWMIQGLTSNELLQLLGDSLSSIDQDQLATMPLILRRELEFPYTEGFLTVSQLQADGGWDAVDAALESPPPSTEQILHPEKLGVDQPVVIDLPDLSVALGADWSQTYTQTFGELGLQVFVAGGEAPNTLPGLPAAWPHQEAAAGWGGDRLAMYEGPDGAWAIDWQTAWDTPADATEFSSRAQELQSTLQGAAEISSGEQTVTLFVASDAGGLATLEAAASGQ